jgi:hypothetical protein
MIEKLTAVEFLGRAETGRSRPMLCICEASDGREVGVYVKYQAFHGDLHLDHLVGELISNIFADDIGLPAAKPCVVEIGADFVDAIPSNTVFSELKNALAGAPIKAFGSTQFEPVRRWAKTDLVHKVQRREALKLYLFDTLVENSDRGIQNPNLLMHGSDFKVIDFGHSFQMCHQGADANQGKLPWQNGGILNHYAGAMQHVMLEPAKAAEKQLIDEFKNVLDGLTDDRIQSYLDCVPQSWGQETALQIVDFLLSARANSQEFIDRAKEVLA